MSFKVIEGYKFDKRIFRLSILLMVLILVGSWGLYDFPDPLNPPVYIHCPEDSKFWCENPFFEGAQSQVWDTTNFKLNTNLEDMSHIPPGYTYGEKPPWLFENLGYIYLLIGIGAFVLNHIKNNKEMDGVV